MVLLSRTVFHYALRRTRDDTLVRQRMREIADYLRPAKPTDNPFIESSGGSFRDECLITNWFLSLEDAKEKIEAFRENYNSFRPHSALCGLTPDEVVADYLKSPELSILERY